MSFMNDFGLITGRDPDGEYHAMTDVIHKVLNDLTVDEWAIIIGGDSHAYVQGRRVWGRLGTVALALATGEASMPIPESVKVTFKGELKPLWISVTSCMLLRIRCWINSPARTYSKGG